MTIHDITAYQYSQCLDGNYSCYGDVENPELLFADLKKQMNEHDPEEQKAKAVLLDKIVYYRWLDFMKCINYFIKECCLFATDEQRKEIEDFFCPKLGYTMDYKKNQKMIDSYERQVDELCREEEKKETKPQSNVERLMAASIYTNTVLTMYYNPRILSIYEFTMYFQQAKARVKAMEDQK